VAISIIVFTRGSEWDGRMNNRAKRQIQNAKEKKVKKLTVRPHARAGSMEVDGYENPDC
jgi:hypothetical protein